MAAHGEWENVPGLIISINGIEEGAPYSAAIQYGTNVSSPGSGLFAGIGEAALLQLYNEETADAWVLRTFNGGWQEWAATMGEARAANGKFSIKIDDSPIVLNSVFSGFRLTSLLRFDGGAIFSDGFESANCSNWGEVEPNCP